MNAVEQFECKFCKELFPAKLSDRKRGWARYCSKSCAAKGSRVKMKNYRRYINRKNHTLNKG